MKTITDLPTAPPRPDDAHKGTFGTVVVIGGNATMLGAPALTTRAALRAGAGLVKIAAPPEVLPHILTIEPSATGLSVSEARQEEAVFAVGPGLGADVDLAAVLPPDRPTVLDADGLNALARALPSAPALPSPLVLTPHPGEFRRLAAPLNISADPTQPDQRPDAAAQLARALNCTVVLKGRHTVVTDGDRCYLNPTGNPALSTAGTGDVLTGLIASLIAQGMTVFDAACLGVHTHGEAADQWATRWGASGMLARELADGIPSVLNASR